MVDVPRAAGCLPGAFLSGPMGQMGSSNCHAATVFGGHLSTWPPHCGTAHTTNQSPLPTTDTQLPTARPLIAREADTLTRPAQARLCPALRPLVASTEVITALPSALSLEL